MKLLRTAAISLLALASVFSSFDGNHRICRRATSSRTVRVGSFHHHQVSILSADEDVTGISAGHPDPPALAAAAPSAALKLWPAFHAIAFLNLFTRPAATAAPAVHSTSPRAPPALA